MASCSKDDVVVNKINETEELLVFGYSCKLFRDDEKALYIDQGKHLIPWMGDETLKIDRYDARGTLFDLSQHEAPSGGFDRFFGLTDKEKQVESMCDEERYKALFTNEEEETMYQEEELKRFHSAIGDKGNSYSQVAYKYEGESNYAEENTENTERSDDGADDEPFVPSPQLDLPVNMVLPETVKQNQIIEKTAMFISSQGPQMEILLKMKQADNPLFSFLSFDNPLHGYYRHLLMAIKTGRYKPDLDNENKKSDAENDDDDHYLHPSLASSVSKVELAPSIPSINYKPSEHCAYSMLVNKIKDKKVNEQVTQQLKLKEPHEELKDEKQNQENGCANANTNHYYYDQSPNAQNYLTPQLNLQVIIDKMASYVAKNGRDFESVVQMKNDPRFDFLNSSHVYHPYYLFKVRQYENIEKSSKPEVKLKEEDANAKPKEDPSKIKVTPVCFSIKKPKDSEPVIEKSALPLEESSDEEGNEGRRLKIGIDERDKDKEKEKEKKEKEKEKEKEKKEKEKDKEKKEKEKDKEKEKEKEKDKEKKEKEKDKEKKEKEKDREKKEKEKDREKKEKEKDKEKKEKEKEKKEDSGTVDSASIENKEEKNRKILAAERLKDKLTAAAREKMAMATKEKQLQLERKRRAAVFLKSINSEGKGSVVYGPQLPGAETADREAKDGSEVASVPEKVDDAKTGEKSAKLKPPDDTKSKSVKNDTRHRSPKSSHVRHKDREKHRSRSEKTEKSADDEIKPKETNERISDSFSSADEEGRRRSGFADRSRKPYRNSDNRRWRSKSEKNRSPRRDKSRHRKRKHKKNDTRHRSSRKHSKGKRGKRSRENDDNCNARSKRSRRNSSYSSDDLNS